MVPTQIEQGAGSEPEVRGSTSSLHNHSLSFSHSKPRRGSRRDVGEAAASATRSDPGGPPDDPVGSSQLTPWISVCRLRVGVVTPARSVRPRSGLRGPCTAGSGARCSTAGIARRKRQSHRHHSHLSPHWSRSGAGCLRPIGGRRGPVPSRHLHNRVWTPVPQRRAGRRRRRNRLRQRQRRERLLGHLNRCHGYGLSGGRAPTPPPAGASPRRTHELVDRALTDEVPLPQLRVVHRLRGHRQEVTASLGVKPPECRVVARIRATLPRTRSRSSRRLRCGREALVRRIRRLAYPLSEGCVVVTTSRCGRCGD